MLYKINNKINKLIIENTYMVVPLENAYSWINKEINDYKWNI